MHITYRQFPHPVVSYFDNGYENASFNTNIESEIEDGFIHITSKFNLQCDYLKKLIDKGLASYLVHLECKTSRFRMTKTTNKDDSIKIKIDSKKVNKEIEVCCLVVSNKEIEDFKCDDFIDDFKGIYFQIDKGEILAHDLNKIIEVQKSGDSDKVPSIFSITYEEGKLHSPLTWQASGKKIIIKISEDNFKKYKQLAKVEKYVSILSNILIVPVLTDIISVIKEDSMSDEYTLSNEDECYKVIENKLKDLGYFSPSSLRKETSVSIAYKLLENLLDSSFKAFDDFGMEEED